jgi:hypothetical protein
MSEVTVITGEDNIRLLSLRVLIRALEAEVRSGLKFSRINTHHAAQGWGVDEPRSRAKRLEGLRKVLAELEATQ